MVVIALKAIKPKRLRVDRIRLEILNELRKEGTVHKKELRKTVRTWTGVRPGFESLIGLTRRDAMVLTGPTGSLKAVQKWVWTDQGTKPHIIRARRVPRLAFRTGFIPKTIPRKFTSRPGRYFGAIRRSVQVRHPGTKARLWSRILTRKRRRPFARRIRKAVRRGAAKAF